MLRDVAVVGRDGKALLYPFGDPAGHVPGIPPRGAERLRGHSRARSQPAVEDHPTVAGDGLRVRRQALELDVPAAFNEPGLALVRLADVDELDLPASQQVGDAVGVELVVGVREDAQDRAFARGAARSAPAAGV